MAPYCLVCGDPIAPSFSSPAADASPPSRSAVPPHDAGLVPWVESLRGAAHTALFKHIGMASADDPQARLVELESTPLSSTRASRNGHYNPRTQTPLPQEIVGWSVVSGTRAIAALIIHLGSNTTSISVEDRLNLEPTSTYTSKSWFPKCRIDVTNATLAAKDLGSTVSERVPAAQALALSPYSLTIVDVQS